MLDVRGEAQPQRGGGLVVVGIASVGSWLQHRLVMSFDASTSVQPGHKAPGTRLAGQSRQSQVPYLQQCSLLYVLDQKALGLSVALLTRLHELCIHTQSSQPPAQPPQHAVQQELGLQTQPDDTGVLSHLSCVYDTRGYGMT